MSKYDALNPAIIEAEATELLKQVPRIVRSENSGTKNYVPLVVELSSQCYIEALMNIDDKTLTIQFFDTRPFQGKGIGEKLLKSLIVEAKANGIEKIVGGSITFSALKTRAKVFGEESLDLYLHEQFSHSIKQPKRIEYSEALSILEDQERQFSQDSRYKPTVRVEAQVNLNKVDTSLWERPKE